MQGRNLREDETTQQAQGEPLPKLGWRDVLALTIAAYQVLLPILLVMVGVLLVAYLLFRLIFLR